MKDLGETLSLTNGAGVAVKGVTNGVASLSRSSSSSSVDLHLTEDSEEDADEQRNDSESVHDPKTSKLAATGANFINMHDSSKQHLEIVKSHYKEIDNSIVESTACSKPNSVKTEDKCFNSGAIDAGECEKDCDTGLQRTRVDVNKTAVAETPARTPRNQCNSSLSEATVNSKEVSLTNGDVKAVVKVKSMATTVIAEPCKILVAGKESNHVAAETSVELNVDVKRINLTNDGGQATPELCTSKGSCKNKEEVDKELKKDCSGKGEVERIALDKDEKDLKDKEEVDRIALDKDSEEDLKDKGEVEKIALDKDEEDLKDKEEVERIALDKETEHDSTEKEEMTTKALDNKIEVCMNNENCDIFNGEYTAPLVESKHSVTTTNSQSGVPKDEDLTPSSEISVVDIEHTTSEPSNLSENVDDSQCSIEVETESSVATSLETEQLTSQVEKTDRSAIESESSSDDAVVSYVPEANESRSSANESGDNDENAGAVTDDSAKNTIIDFSDSADEPGEVNVCPEGSQSDLIIDLDEDTGEATKDTETHDTFDMLPKHEINKTLESVCTQEGRRAQQSQADVSPAGHDSSGFSVHAHKRVSSVNDVIESKKAKLTNGHSTQDVDSIDLTGEKTCSKRALEFSDMLQSKKARVLIDESSPSTTLSEQVPKKPEPEIALEETSTVPAIPRRSLSNIDKAIERVAFAGLDRKERAMMPFIKDLKNRRLQDITIDDLEELVTQRMGEVLSETGENGVLREKVQKLEKMTEFWKHKATSLQKQLSDMTMVFKKLATETKQNSNQMQIPIKITRSVGLQVIMPSLQLVSKSNATHVRNGLPPGTKRKSGGIMTNRNTTPTHHYPPSTAVSPNRTPVVQKVVTPIKLPQAVSAPKPPTVAPPSAIRFRAPTSVVNSVVPTGTVMTVAGNLRTAASTTNRPVVKSVTPRPTSDMLIDLTDEDDKTKRASSNPLSQPLRVAQLNGSPPTLGNTIRFGSSQQLTGIAKGANSQRLTYMLPASAGNATTGRLQLFTQQTSGNLRPSGLLTVRPSTQTGTLMLKNGAVVSSATSPANIMRAATTGTYQQVVARPGQMRTIQPANRLTESSASRPVTSLSQHPAPLPPPPPEFPSNPSWKKPPPRPDLKISKVDNREQHGIILSWNMDHGTEHEEIASYQLYAYQENNSPPSTSQWKKVGDVKAMPLPMACTLTQFLEGNKYHFAVRAIDIHSRSGLFSVPGHIILPRRGS